MSKKTDSPLDVLSDETREALRARQQPDWTSPMLATLTDDPFSDPEWVYERKLDGERFLTFRHGDDVRLLSRNRKELNPSYPELVEAFEGQPTEDFIVDGEIVAFDGNLTSFARLQPRMQTHDPDEARRSDVTVFCYLFDVLHVDGQDTTTLPLRDRKRVLEQTIDFSDPLRYATHRNEDGEAYHREACEKGWEGVIAKKADSPYAHSRSTDWLKFKCVAAQELVIGGFTEPEGSRVGFGALLVGYYDDGDLVYAGKVGTGYDEETLARLRNRLEGLERKTSPFAGDVREKGARWATPDLVGEFGFTEWTQDGKLRHPRFKGLRRDKDPHDVVKEETSSR